MNAGRVDIRGRVWPFPFCTVAATCRWQTRLPTRFHGSVWRVTFHPPLSQSITVALPMKDGGSLQRSLPGPNACDPSRVIDVGPGGAPDRKCR